MTDAARGTAPGRPPWGYVATLAWALLAAGLSIAATFVVLMRWHGARPEAPDLTGDGVLFSSLAITATFVQTAVLVLAARLARWRVDDYLALVRPSGREALVALAACAVVVLGYDALTVMLGRDVVTPFQLEIYRSAQGQGSLWLLVITLVIVAPLGEEVLFRGFLYRGWARSPRAVAPAIIAISAAWASIHVQYDWFGIVQVFIIGLLLGWIRWRSGSTLLTIALHAIVNAWATIQTAVEVGWLS